MTTSRSDLHPYLVAQYAVILWDHGYSVAEICKVLGRYHTTIRHHLKKAGRVQSYGKVGRPSIDVYVETRSTPAAPIPKDLKGRIRECGLKIRRT